MVKAGELLTYDPSGTFLEPGGISPDDLAALAPRLEMVRRELIDDAIVCARGNGQAPPEDGPRDEAFLELPERTLDDYVDHREASELGRILSTAHRLRNSVDRAVLFGSAEACLAARAMLDACCEPFFNELTRGQRGGRPRVYFAGNSFDNDAAVGLLTLLTEGRSPSRLEDRWAIVVIGTRCCTLETVVAYRQFSAALRDFYQCDERWAGQLVVPVTDAPDGLWGPLDVLTCEDRLRVPEGVGHHFSVFSPTGLLPAALVGLDVVRLLEGASAMNDHFRAAAPGRNAVLDFVSVGHLMESKRRATIRVLRIWAAALGSVGRWYDLLLAESLRECNRHDAMLNAVSAGDLHSAGQQHLQGRRDQLVTNLIVDNWRCDPWSVARSDAEEDALRDLADRTLPDLMMTAVRSTSDASRADGRPAADIHLPRLNEYTLGQLMQMLMLTTVVEGRLKESEE